MPSCGKIIWYASSLYHVRHDSATAGAHPILHWNCVVITAIVDPMKTFNRHTVFNGLVFDIEQMQVEIGSRGSHTFQVIRHPGGAAVLPVHADGSLSLIRQLRPAVDAHLLEVPAGRLGPDEPPLLCAARELQEETGMRAEMLTPLGMVYSSPGVFDEVVYLYAATGISQGEAALEDDEDIEVVRLSMAEAHAMVLDGRISDAKTVAVLFRWEMLKHSGKDYA
jgi:ADP-ribose pyrophosphatase